MNILIEDTRQQSKKHKNIHDWCEANGIKIVRNKLPVGDYSLMNDMTTCIDTKKDMVEVSQNIYQDHKRFKAELQRAEEFGINLVILIEDDGVKDFDDVVNWINPHPNRTALTPDGDRCYQVMKTMSNKYGVIWRFCKKSETGAVIWEMLNGSL